MNEPLFIKPGETVRGRAEDFARGEPCKIAGRTRKARIFELSYAAGIAGIYADGIVGICAERIIDLEDRVAALEAAQGYQPAGIENRIDCGEAEETR